MLKLDYKRKTTVLPVVFVLIGMALLVPAITDNKVLAETRAIASPPFGVAHFTNVIPVLDRGRFIVEPIEPSVVSGDLEWVTTGATGSFPFGTAAGSEEGTVEVDVVCNKPIAGTPCVSSGTFLGKATFFFNNPLSGENTCRTDLSNTRTPNILVSACSITQGTYADARFLVDSPVRLGRLP